jgi:hypothetical protein
MVLWFEALSVLDRSNTRAERSNPLGDCVLYVCTRFILLTASYAQNLRGLLFDPETEDGICVISRNVIHIKYTSDN